MAKKSADKIKVVIQGWGDIGLSAAREISKDKGIEIVGAVDTKNHIGDDIGELIGIGSMDVKVSSDPEEIIKKTKPNVIVLTTCSRLDQVLPSLYLAIKHKVNVASSAEDLFYPEYVSLKKAIKLHMRAATEGSTIIGTGPNPGGYLDACVIACKEREGLSPLITKAHREDDISWRRLALNRKAGAGDSIDIYERRCYLKEIGHQGMRMTAVYVADCLGYQGFRVNFKRRPVIADDNIETLHGVIKRGDVAGIEETCMVLVPDGKSSKPPIRVELVLRLYAGAKNQNYAEFFCKDGVKRFDFCTSINGDNMTAMILHDAVRHALNSAPGLNTERYVPRLIMDPSIRFL